MNTSWDEPGDRVLLHFLRNTLHLPYPLAVWLTAFWDTLYGIASTPLGILISMLFLLIGYLRLSTVNVAVLAAALGLWLAQSKWQGWASYSAEFRIHHVILVIAASLALCFACNFIGRRLRSTFI